MNWLKYFILVPGLLFPVTGCDKKEQPDYQYSVPVLVNDGWAVGSAADAGMNIRLLEAMMNQITLTSNHGIHSIILIKDGKVVFEEYFEGYLFSSDPPGSDGDRVLYDRETDHYLASVSKSVTSVIFGAAMKEGYIPDVNTKLIDALPEYQDILTGDKSDITLEHLLTMTSGLSWDESSTPYTDPANDVVALFQPGDPVEYILSKDMYNVPGKEFLYNSGGTNVLGVVVEKFTGMSLLDFGNECLFAPLNVQGGSWQKMAGDCFFASGGISLRPRELAKIGYLFLNDGCWEGHRVITEPWITESVRERIDTHGKTLWQAHAYGYQWWMADFDANGKVYESFMAAGWGDQYMMIIPEIEMIIVFNGGNYLIPGSLSPFGLVEDYVFPSL